MVAVLNFNLKDQAQIRDHIRVIGVRGTTRLMWIIANDSTLLFAIQGFNRHIRIQYPRLTEQGTVTISQLLLQPMNTFFLIDLPQCSASTVITDYFSHAQ